MKHCSSCDEDKPESEFYSRGGKQSHRLSAFCKSCSKRYTVSRQKGLKERILKEINVSACQICKYDRYTGALEFHHKNPKEKDFQISKASSRSFKSILEEVRKCVVLCSCCHKEVHAGLIDV